MGERARDAGAHALNIGIPDEDGRGHVVTNPDACRSFLGIGQNQFLVGATTGNVVSCCNDEVVGALPNTAAFSYVFVR